MDLDRVRVRDPRFLFVGVVLFSFVIAGIAAETGAGLGARRVWVFSCDMLVQNQGSSEWQTCLEKHDLGPCGRS